MARMMRFAVLLLAIVPSFAAEDSNFALWTPAAIKQREAALTKMVGPDH
ncbi:MAG: hypothetical protein ABSC37_21775 [Xanthobacteraceae bacterium]|jgi:hypothetical protein